MHFIKFLIFILFTSSFYADEVSIGQKDFSRLTKMLHKQVKKGNYPGFFTLIQKDGELIYSDIVGFSNIEEGVKLDKDSLFRIYSMTKPITGVALMIAVDRGLVNLSDPVSKYIPEFASTKVLSENNSDLLDLVKPITLLELATHTSGLAYSFSIKGKIKEFYEKQKIYPYYAIDNFNDDLSLEKFYSNICEFSQKVATVPLAHQPGEKWTYSIGMDILGCVIERAAKITFGKFLEENIFEPLDMNDTFFQVPKNKRFRMTNLYAHIDGFDQFGAELPKGYKKSNSKLVLVDKANSSAYFNKVSIEDGGSGLVSSAQDYLKFGQMLLERGVYQGKRIISEESYRTLTSNQLNEKNQRFDAFGFGITLGISIDSSKLRQKRGDGSFFWGGAAKTKFWVDPENNLVLVNMTQLLGSPKDLGRNIDKLVYKDLKKLEKIN
jgi:CubicO group peptidase (beta-lactamase class C family)